MKLDDFLSLCIVSCAQRSHPRVNVDSIQIFDTPKRLIRSLQDPTDESSDCSEKPIRRYKSLSSGNIDWSPSAYSKYDQSGLANHDNYDGKEYGSSCGDGQYQGESESVSSTDELPADADNQRLSEEVRESRKDPQIVRVEKPIQTTKRRFVCGLSFVILAVATPLIWLNSQEEAHFLVPT